MKTINQLGSLVVSGAVAVEVIVQPNEHTVYFPDISTLRGKNIKHIDVCDELTISALGNFILDSTTEAYITFIKNGTQVQIIKDLPLTELQTSKRKGNRLCINHVFDIEASFVTIPNNTLANPRSIYFIFWFDEPYVAGLIDCKAETNISYFELSLERDRTYFPENMTLYNRKFRNIMLSLPGITAEKRTGITETTLYKSFITLQKNNLQFFQAVPLYLFFQINDYYMLNLQNIKFDFTNSYIDVIDPVDEDLQTVFFNCIIE